MDIRGATARLVDFAAGATERQRIVFNGTEFRDYTTSAVRCEAVAGETSLIMDNCYFAPNGGTDHVDANGTYEHLSRRGFLEGGGFYQPDNEGTWTPTFGDATNDATLDPQSQATWRRNGNRVTISGEVNLTSKASISGSMLLKNLPFPISAALPADGGGTATWVSGLDTGVTSAITLRALANDEFMGLYNAANGGSSNVDATEITDSFRFFFSATYVTDG